MEVLTVEDDEVICQLLQIQLERGADDFVVKPLSVRELMARVLAVRRRRDPEAHTLLRFGQLEIDLRSRRAALSGGKIDLTPKEFDLLAFLAARPGNAFSRDAILRSVWHSASEWQQEATVTEHVSRLRSKNRGRPSPATAARNGAGSRIPLRPPRRRRPRRAHRGAVSDLSHHIP